MKVLRVPPMYRCIGLVDADLLDNGSRHPNLALLKIAGFLSDNGIMFELILDSQADISRYDRIYLSKVFTFTKDPEFYVNAKGTPDEAKFEVLCRMILWRHSLRRWTNRSGYDSRS